MVCVQYTHEEIRTHTHDYKVSSIAFRNCSVPFNKMFCRRRRRRYFSLSNHLILSPCDIDIATCSFEKDVTLILQKILSFRMAQHEKEWLQTREEKNWLSNHSKRKWFLTIFSVIANFLLWYDDDDRNREWRREREKRREWDLYTTSNDIIVVLEFKRDRFSKHQ